MIAPIAAEDAEAGFRSGVHPLDDYLCVGVIVDAKDEGAERFYLKYCPGNLRGQSSFWGV